MPTSAFVKFEVLTEHLDKKIHNFFTDVLKVYFTNTTPNVATNQVKADLAELGAGGGYVAGGYSVTSSASRTGGVTSVVGVDVVVTAAGGAIGPFRFVVLYNDTPTSPADPLVGYWDYGAALTLNDTEPLTVDFGTSLFTVT